MVMGQGMVDSVSKLSPASDLPIDGEKSKEADERTH